MSHEPTPLEVQAAIIADLEAKLSLANEREFYLMAENARLRAGMGNNRDEPRPSKNH